MYMASFRPEFKDLIPKKPDLDTINSIKHQAYQSAYNLLACLNDNKLELQIATAESLTAGMIMSTLVDIPWLGRLKYGCFGVYDTDAKRTFLGVKVDNVYTHKCAAEMVVGVLKNSNAALAISVTGNAMPLNEDNEMLGEVFIGIAGYNKENQIIYITKSINACMEANNNEFKEKCKNWVKTIQDGKQDEKYTTFNKILDTAAISQEIRYYTTHIALQLCKEFIEANKENLICPKRIADRKKKNMHQNIPANKYSLKLDEKCLNKPAKNCDISGSKSASYNNNPYITRKNRKGRKARRHSRRSKYLV